jgi:very-short-patch-repair endonuclease
MLILKKLNVEIEFDKSFHKNQTDKDFIRETNIYNEIGCSFLEFLKKEWIQSKSRIILKFKNFISQ